MSLLDGVRAECGSAGPAVAFDLFSASQCERLITEGENRWRPSLVSTYSNGSLADGSAAAQERAVRSTDEYCPDRSHPDLAGHLMSTLLAVNADVYGYDVSAAIEATTVTTLRYCATRRDHFAFHRDLGPDNSTRKLSFSVQLSDANEYVGGDLLFAGHDTRSPRRRGSLTVFPAFLPHRVTTVLAGTRYSLVGWVHGPAFR